MFSFVFGDPIGTPGVLASLETQLGIQGPIPKEIKEDKEDSEDNAGYTGLIRPLRAL